MDDLISRKMAIDALAKHEKSKGHNYTLFVDIVSECAEVIRNIPSAQQEEKVTEILDYLNAELHPIISPEHWNVYSELYDMIASLPSAQSERKRGKWARAMDGNDGHVKCDNCFTTYDYISEAQYYNYCPNCGADMRGEENDGKD